MRILDWFRRDGSTSRRPLQELYRSSEQGVPLPEVGPESRDEFEADQQLIDRISELASSAGPTDAALQRSALLSRVAEKRKGLHVEEGTPMLRQLLRKRTLAGAGAAILLVGAAATVGAAGGASHITGTAEDVLDVLQITNRTPKVDICHVPDDNPDNAHTISVAESALEEHLAHGDSEGACAGDGTPGPVGPSAKVDVCHIPEENPDNAHTVSVPESALEEHLAHGDTLGACADAGTPGSVGPSAKVDVCHIPGENPDNAHTISVAESALEEHLAHGDSVGACADAGTPGPPDGVGPSAKVDVCHIPDEDPDNARTISVPQSALEEHLAHGDSEGACPDAGTPGPPEGVGPSAKVDVCHIPEENPDNARTISVPQSALEEHLAHGDTPGACAESTVPIGGP
jgi:uncharacterized cupin superfamily protein